MQTILQDGFGGGELSPKFWNDRKLKQYPISLKTCRNFKIDRAGKLAKAPGTVYVPGSIGPSVSPRLIPFFTSAQSGYVFEFLVGTIYVYQNGEQVQPVLSAWSSTVTYVAGQTVDGGGGGEYYVAIPNDAPNMNVQPGVTSGWQNFWLKANGGYQIPCPYTMADSQTIKFRQVNGVLFLVHPNYPPQQIVISSNSQPFFSCTPIPFSPTQNSLANNMGATNGSLGGDFNYEYLITTENTLTGEESFPGIVGSAGGSNTIVSIYTSSMWGGTLFPYQNNGPPGSAKFNPVPPGGYTCHCVTSIPNGFSAGEYVYFSGVNWSTISGAEFNNVSILINSIDSPTSFTFRRVLQYPNYFTFQYGLFGSGGSVSAPTAPKISTISQTNPCVVATTVSNGFVAGDIVTLIGTGVPQLEGKPFVVGPLNTSGPYTFVLQGIDSTNFIIPGTITGNAFINDLKIGLSAVISPSNPINVAWNGPTSQSAGNSIFYNIYRNDGAGFGFVTSTFANTYVDIGTPPDLAEDPPSYNAMFQTPGDYPSWIEVFQQRLVVGNTKNNSLEFDASRNGFPNNFTDHAAGLQANDAVVKQTVQTEAASVVQDAVDFGFLILFTDQHEMVVRGDSTGTMTPEEINFTRQMFNGAAFLKPLKMNKSIIYLQANTSMIRDLQVQITPYGMTYLAVSNELTLFSQHLVQGFSIQDWDYQKIYDSEIYAVRSDGTIIATPYDVEKGIDAAWWRRDTQGQFGNICCVPEGLELAIYVTALRPQAGGVNAWRIERFSSEQWTNLLDANYLDGAIITDGRNSNVAPTTTMTLSLGASTLWDGSQKLTLTASAGFFTAGMVGDWIYLYGQSVYDINGNLVTPGFEIHFQITGYTSSTVVTGTVQSVVPDGATAFGTDGTIYTNMRNAAQSVWGHAVNSVSGIPLGGQVAIVGDGMVQSNPYNLRKGQSPISVVPDNYITGTVALPQPAVVVIVGKPYFSDFETLDLDQDPKDSAINKKTALKQAVGMVTSTQGYWVGSENPDTNKQAPQNLPGPPQTPSYIYGLTETKIRDSADYDSSVDMVTGRVLTDFSGTFDYGARLFVRSPDPIPCNFSAIGFAVATPSVGK